MEMLDIVISRFENQVLTTLYYQMSQKQITVTSPLLPDLSEFIPYLEDIWERRWLTNNGHYHQLLEDALCEYLQVPYLSLFTNGTLPLIAALQALRISGEVITTPFSFVATTHSIWWNGLKPVFVDVDPLTCNLDPAKIEAAITPRTSAIMPVHVYGNPCDTTAIKEIADKYGLKVIYDAAHAFGVKSYDNNNILTSGDISTLSFHATKVFSTIEGGALISQDLEMKKRIDYLKNFGFENEITVVAPGINGKLDEVRAAFGLLSLKHLDRSIEVRKSVTEFYRSNLSNIEGVTLIPINNKVISNFSYFPIFVDSDKFSMSRDDLYYKFKNENILARRYFYPLISEFSTYKGMDSASPLNLPVAHEKAQSVLCLPLHDKLDTDDLCRIVSIITGQDL